jgi:uncharacterized protein (DUF433 family)
MLHPVLDETAVTETRSLAFQDGHCCTADLSSMIDKMATQSEPQPQTLPVIAEYISLRPGHCDGKPHITGHRIKVQHVAIWHERMGMTPEEIAATYPSISLPAIHAALAYYYSHRTDIDADIDRDEHFAEEMEAKAGPSKLRAKLNAE